MVLYLHIGTLPWAKGLCLLQIPTLYKSTFFYLTLLLTSPRKRHDINPAGTFFTDEVIKVNPNALQSATRHRSSLTQASCYLKGQIQSINRCASSQVPLLHSRFCAVPQSASTPCLLPETSHSMHGKPNPLSSFPLSHSQNDLLLFPASVNTIPTRHSYLT